MLGVNRYPEEYVNDCRSSMESQLAAYRALRAAAGGKAAGRAAASSALASFEPLFFNNLVIVLDGYFVHRSIRS
jgi:hypothetical protein